MSRIASILSPTTFLAWGDSVSCSRTQYCDFVSDKIALAGQPCPKCNQGVCEPRNHQVCLCDNDAIGKCSCEHFAFKIQPLINSTSPGDRAGLTVEEYQKLFVCKHLAEVRAEVKASDDMFDDILRLVPMERKDGP